MRYVKTFRFRLFLSILLAFVWSLEGLAQDTSGNKVRPVKTAKVNMLEIEKSAVNKADTLQKVKKAPNLEEIPPGDLDIPEDATIIRHRPPPKSGDSAVFSVRQKNSNLPNFPGLGDNNASIPPDIGGAVGPNHLMVALNTQVRIQTKVGANLSTVTLNAFFSPLGGSPNMFDPKVLYDPFEQRWIITAVANGGLATSALMLGVSDTDDPTGTWSLYQYLTDATNTNWFDYPSIGFNKNWIVVTGNMFAISDNSFAGTAHYIFDKGATYGGTATPTVLSRPTTEGFTICPAITLDNTQETLYMVTSWNSGVGALRLYTITGTPAAPVYTMTSLFPTSTSGWAAIPAGGADFAPQSGSTNLIANGDRRIQNAVFRNGSLWTTHTIFLPAGTSPTRSGVQWWEINPTTGAVLQNEKIQDATGTNFFAYPTLGVNAYDDLLIGYSSFSAGQFASSNFSIRLNTDPLNVTQATTQFKAGLAKYFKVFSTSNRWGDYSSTTIDPDDFSIWTIQQYAELPVSGSDRWGTEWNQWIPPVADLYSKDLTNDLGAEPNPLPGSMYQSPDIWVRKLQDPTLAFAHVHENAEYRTGTSNPNYVYVEVHNRGTVASTGTEQITLYWAKAGAGLGWLDPWNGGVFFDPGPNTMLMGDVIGTLTIPVVAPGASTIVEFAWNPPDPALYATAFGTNTNHFCLLSRITTSGTSPFGMTFPETTSINGNVRNNNNIVWKNIGVYDLATGTMAPAQAVIGNMTDLQMRAGFRFRLLDQDGNIGLFERGRIRVTPVGQMEAYFKENPPKGRGIKLNNDGTIDVFEQGATINDVLLDPKTFGLLNMAYFPDENQEVGKGYAIDFTQVADNAGQEEVIGGQTFVFGQVAGFLTQPDGDSKPWFNCPWWCWVIIIIIIIIIIWWLRRKKNP
ncbi:MAG: hypothetical protein ABJM06_10115 [Gilvibacter sp.]